MDHRKTPDPSEGITPPAPSPSAQENVPAAEDLSFGVWLTRNVPFLVMMIAGFLFVWLYLGWSPMAIATVALGLGLVIFIHELGHFLVAKWCDVHVETFSIGFGPALPGCRFQRGETTYKIAVFPLGGYVKMVGEGDDSEEEDDNPRSFKNKTVSQRMAIISAGVVMNVVLGFVLFITVFMWHGDKRTPGIVGHVQTGGPAWQEGVRSASQFLQIGNVENPSFDDLMPQVGLSGEDQQLRFVITEPDLGDDEGALAARHSKDGRRELWIKPRLAKGDKRPVIGVAAPIDLRLLSRRAAQKRTIPSGFESAAAKAREIDLQAGDHIISTTNPDDPQALLDMPSPPPGQDYDFREFNRRLERLAGKAITIAVRRHGQSPNDKPQEIQLPAAGFQFDDQIVGTTDPHGTPFNPHRITPLALDPADPEREHFDYFDFDRRCKLLAGQPMIVQVRRHGAARDAKPISLWVPPAYHFTFKGLRLRMGKVAALRQQSTGATAAILRGDKDYGPGVKPGDRIDQVEFTEANGKAVRLVSSPTKPADGAIERVLDPVRLPFELERWADRMRAAGVKDPKVRLTVRRVNPKTHNENDSVTLEAAWDDSWRFDGAIPYMAASPTALAGLGIAYYIDSTIEAAAPDSAAAAENLEKGDRIKAVKFFKPLNKPGDPEETERDWRKLKSEEPSSLDEYNRWAYVDLMLQAEVLDVHKLVLLVDHEGVEREVTLAAEPDPTWPEADRGWGLTGQRRLRKAESLAQAIEWGTKRTTDSIYYIYLGLLRMATGRLSFTENVTGPIGIAEAAYTLAGEDFSDFLLFLAVISVNLAVVNFLPIPVLDGGHMVFLVYEKLRGRPASEQVRIAATYVGLALIVSLMLVVIFLDVQRRWL